MIATKTPSTYIENTLELSTTMLAHRTTLKGSLPNLNAGTITNINFLTSNPNMIVGSGLLLITPAHSEGFQTPVTVVVDNLDGTWTVSYVDMLTDIPTAVFSSPTVMAEFPQLVTSQNADVNRVFTADRTLAFVSAIATEFVGTSEFEGMLAIGDSILIDDGVVVDPVPVVLTAVVESGTVPSVTYTCTYVAAIIATLDATVLGRGALNAVVDVYRDSPSNQDVTIEYANQTALTGTWSAVSRKLTAEQDWVIVEPLTLTYSEEIVIP